VLLAAPVLGAAFFGAAFFGAAFFGAAFFGAAFFGAAFLGAAFFGTAFFGAAFFGAAFFDAALFVVRFAPMESARVACLTGPGPCAIRVDAPRVGRWHPGHDPRPHPLRPPALRARGDVDGGPRDLPRPLLVGAARERGDLFAGLLRRGRLRRAVAVRAALPGS